MKHKQEETLANVNGKTNRRYAAINSIVLRHAKQAKESTFGARFYSVQAAAKSLGPSWSLDFVRTKNPEFNLSMMGVGISMVMNAISVIFDQTEDKDSGWAFRGCGFGLVQLWLFIFHL
ncbi:hypothetical protein VNO78_31002 [Psophocarpus tetragonolobus]|uniref:Uncharacterized protein n=1 Tax=Psophocarpus tetragonolobus TaxID=3891 RepID=A0AAN9X6T8_PSOTE